MVVVLLLTIAAFAYFYAIHPEIRAQLSHISPVTLGLLLLLYLIQVAIVGLTLLYTLALCNVKLAYRETFLLTMYSAVINFFGPLQSGPALRAVYLRKKHGLKIKNFTLATIVYLGFYALFSGLFLLSGLLKWWLVALVVVIVLIFIWGKHSQLPIVERLKQLHLQSLGMLALVSLLQVASIAAIYYTELRAVDPAVHISQAVVYTGAANFALFVALTPGAIGFRESFLLFSRHLHHISSSNIVTANVIDRGVYILLLLLLAAAIFGTHASENFRVKSEKPPSESS